MCLIRVRPLPWSRKRACPRPPLHWPPIAPSLSGLTRYPNYTWVDLYRRSVVPGRGLMIAYNSCSYMIRVRSPPSAAAFLATDRALALRADQVP